MRRLEDSLPMQLLRAREVIMQRFRPNLTRFNLSEPQWRVIRALAESEEMSIAELSHRCVLHPASLSRIISTLVEDGRIVRTVNASDRRSVTLSLTGLGREVFEGLKPINDAMYVDFVKSVGSDCVTELYAALGDFIGAVARMEPERSENVIPRASRRRSTPDDAAAINAAGE
jgi:homoprotocatechuate degradation regulator HpaR